MAEASKQCAATTRRNSTSPTSDNTEGQPSPPTHQRTRIIRDARGVAGAWCTAIRRKRIKVAFHRAGGLSSRPKTLPDAQHTRSPVTLLIPDSSV